MISSQAVMLLMTLLLLPATAPASARPAPEREVEPSVAIDSSHAPEAQLGDASLQHLLDLAERIEAGEVEVPSDLDQGGWESVAVAGATCGRGAPFKYYRNLSSTPDAGIFFLLSGGGACMKEGPAPAGAQGIAQSLYCMDFPNFEDPFFSDTLFTGIGAAAIPIALPLFNRGDAANPFKDFHYVAVPYCTGDVFAGRMTEPYDYDPTDQTFEVLHRGHNNFMAIVDEMYARYPADRPVLLTGMSAGGFGAIYNFPEVIERWPSTVLLPDSGIAPPISDSLLAREGDNVAARWGADALLPDYCDTPECQASTYRLLAAHAAHFDGSPGPWRPFGYLQGQQDGTLVQYLETTPCGYQQGIRRGLDEARPGNLRGYIPATDKHVFSIVVEPPNFFQGRPYVSESGVNFLDWFKAVGTAASAEDLPADMVDPWLGCNETFLPRASLRD